MNRLQWSKHPKFNHVCRLAMEAIPSEMKRDFLCSQIKRIGARKTGSIFHSWIANRVRRTKNETRAKYVKKVYRLLSSSNNTLLEFVFSYFSGQQEQLFIIRHFKVYFQKALEISIEEYRQMVVKLDRTYDTIFTSTRDFLEQKILIRSDGHAQVVVIKSVSFNSIFVERNGGQQELRYQKLNYWECKTCSNPDASFLIQGFDVPWTIDWYSLELMDRHHDFVEISKPFKLNITSTFSSRGYQYCRSFLLSFLQLLTFLNYRLGCINIGQDDITFLLNEKLLTREVLHSDVIVRFLHMTTNISSDILGIVASFLDLQEKTEARIEMFTIK